MNDFKKLALVAAIIAGLAVIGFLSNSQQTNVRAAGGPTVTIDPTQLPLPVQGSLGVSGSVAATQSGLWNVGITGTPSVNVANPATAPVPALNVNEPGRTAYQHLLTGGCFSVICGGTNSGAVPNGHRLVVEHISVNAVATSSTTSAEMEAYATLPNGSQGPVLTSFPVTVSALGQLGTLVNADQRVLVYLDQGQQPSFTVKVNNSLNGNYTISFFGYLIDCTIAPCAAIAQ